MRVLLFTLLGTLLWGQDVVLLLPCDDYWAGVRAFEQGRYADAERLLAKASEQEPTRGEAWLQLGFARGKMGDAAGKIEAWEKAIRAQPRFPDALYSLGLAYALRGDRTAAATQYGKLKEIDAERAERLRAIIQAIHVDPLDEDLIPRDAPKQPPVKSNIA